MKEYLLLFRGGDGGDTLRQSPEKWQTHMQQWIAWMGELTKQGKFGGAQPLKKEGKVISDNGKVVTDGPFMEGKEMVGGYLVCRAATYDEALSIAKECPVLTFADGIVEVREIQEMIM